MLSKIIRFFLEERLLTLLLVLLGIGWGLVTAPFDYDLGILPRDPVAVDAIPDIGENQQIVFTEWKGRSPQDMDDQVTYPLTSALMGIPGIKTVRASSMLGFSSIYLIFEEDIEFYWSRSRILEKLNSLPAGLLPDGVKPALGPDATGLGQIFWYTLEGRDEKGNPAEGWDPQELRSLQDFYVRYGLASASGVSEVASIGGYVKEYQVDVDPAALSAYNVTLEQVGEAVKNSNLDIGARTLEINRAEYLVRGIGYVKSITDLEEASVVTRGNTSVLLKDVARISIGPADRRGILDKSGAEAVGGVVVARYGENPLAVIQSVKEKIAEIAPGLPEKILEDGRKSKVTVVPFYDRTVLIKETLNTLNEALQLEIIITILVVLLMVANLRAALLISSLLPIAVLLTFVAMRYTGVDANIVALSGIAIAIGTMVDVGIVLVENILRHLKEKTDEGKSLLETIFTATTEVAPAVVTAVLTTIVSFIPVFALQAAEGKLFRPLAFTKSYALVAAIVIALIVIPAFAYLLFSLKGQKERKKIKTSSWSRYLSIGITVVAVTLLLAILWMPLGSGRHLILNILFVLAVVAPILGLFYLIIRYYRNILSWCLRFKLIFLSIPTAIAICGVIIWMGMGKEFMPALDEGSFLLMPTSMPHAGVAQNKEILQRLDMAVTAIPEVDFVVGKAGRVSSALDPAPLSMYENVIHYKSEYTLNEKGKRVRQWRDHIHSPDDIWQEIINVTRIPGVTSAPKLQPIETRLVMLQTGMRAPMGIKVKGPDLTTIEAFGQELETLIQKVPGVKKEAVFAERIVGKPYLNLVINRKQVARYGVSVSGLQRSIQMAIGGMSMGTTIEGRERYQIRVRYAREYRDNPEAIANLLISTPSGQQVPLEELVDIQYEQGPQAIKSENTFLVGYVLFDKIKGFAETDVVVDAKTFLDEKIKSGELIVPAGVSFVFAGNYENQVRAENRLKVIVPLCLLLIFLLLYFQFRSGSTTLMVFSGIAVAFAGGFIMLWLFGQEGFMNIGNLRELFNIQTVNLSVAVWVGFIALFGIATDDGVLIATYLDQVFSANKPTTKNEVRAAVIEAGSRRVRPALMTTATTLLALLPILTSTGRGADVMIPMAIPVFGGMTIAVLTIFVVPVLYAWREERRVGIFTAKAQRRGGGRQEKEV